MYSAGGTWNPVDEHGQSARMSLRASGRTFDLDQLLDSVHDRVMAILRANADVAWTIDKRRAQQRNSDDGPVVSQPPSTIVSRVALSFA